MVYDAHTCPNCSGFWLGPKQLKDIEATVDQRFIEIRSIPPADLQQVPLKCPACPGGVVMDKVASPRDANVVMDICPSCKHVWLDRGEREAIQQDSFLVLLRDFFFSPKPAR
jgi:Zn-finger nucleic acid-binding protein